MTSERGNVQRKSIQFEICSKKNYLDMGKDF